MLNAGRGSNLKDPPPAFTEHRVVMVATILNGRRAVQMSVYVVRAFVKLRQALVPNAVAAR